jgi:hypothetical protein
MRQIFKEGTPLGEIAEPRAGLQTGSNNLFVRMWWEIPYQKIGFNFRTRGEAQLSGRKWFPYNKGGEFRKWYGNAECVLNWEDDGRDIRADKLDKLSRGLCLPSNSKPKNQEYYFRPGITWTFISSGSFAVRLADPGYLFDIAGSTVFPAEEDILVILGLLASIISFKALQATNPTLNFQVGNVGQIPVFNNIPPEMRMEVTSTVKEAIQISRADWDQVETSWNFCFDVNNLKCMTVAHYVEEQVTTQSVRQQRLLELETLNNKLFLQAYRLQDEVSPDVAIEDISLRSLDKRELIELLASFSIGCMMGRYSLDALGLIYANSGNIDFNPSRYKKFPADSDGVIPILDYPWFADDITTRLQEFLIACWSKDTLEENMKFVADSLEPKQGDTPEETIRRYFCDDFFKNHLKMYKKRPIYWLFSSGKEKAFQALVYLHRYNEQTLSKMRTDYVLPLQGKMSNEEKRLDAQIDTASTPAERNRFKKQLEKLKKKQVELRKFDELLHHYADKRISLDLDDGVKVNYGKFGALLAEVKQVTGGSEE